MIARTLADDGINELLDRIAATLDGRDYSEWNCAIGGWLLWSQHRALMV